jgi:hypothetical protein
LKTDLVVCYPYETGGIPVVRPTLAVRNCVEPEMKQKPYGSEPVTSG